MPELSAGVHVLFITYTFAKIQNNAELEKHFWMINAVQSINKGIKNY